LATAHQESEAEDATLVAPVEGGERILGARCHQLKQFVITWSYRSHHFQLKFQPSADMSNSPGETKNFQIISDPCKRRCSRK
jgi:hypothetical protein